MTAWKVTIRAGTQWAAEKMWKPFRLLTMWRVHTHCAVHSLSPPLKVQGLFVFFLINLIHFFDHDSKQRDTEEFTIDIWKCYSFERWVTFCPFTPHYWRRPSSKWSALSECPVYDAPHTSRVDRSKLKSGRTKTRLALCHNQKNFSPLTSLWDPQGQTLDDKRMNKQQICPLWLSLCDK